MKTIKLEKEMKKLQLKWNHTEAKGLKKKRQLIVKN